MNGGENGHAFLYGALQRVSPSRAFSPPVDVAKAVGTFKVVGLLMVAMVIVLEPSS